jgi:hypothetical protein
VRSLWLVGWLVGVTMLARVGSTNFLHWLFPLFSTGDSMTPNLQLEDRKFLTTKPLDVLPNGPEIVFDYETIGVDTYRKP